MSASPDDLQRQAFPVFDAALIAALRPFASERATQPGDVLFEVGDSYYPLVVVLEGRTHVSEGVYEGAWSGSMGGWHRNDTRPT